MMGLYQFKEFLTLDDVADYLRDKGVYDFDLSNTYSHHKLKDWLVTMVKAEKITPVHYYATLLYAKANAYNILHDKYADEHYGFFDGYLGLDKYFYTEIVQEKTGMIKLPLDSVKTINIEPFYEKSMYILPNFFIVKDNLNEFKDFLEKNTNRSIRYFMIGLDKWEFIEFYNLNYPKSELDALFNTKDDSQHTADLRAENARLQARIAELESQTNAMPANDDIELTGTSKKAATRLLYALLREHNYSIDGTTKGATNQILENLTTRHDVGISRQTIANWLAEINTLHYNKNK